MSFEPRKDFLDLWNPTARLDLAVDYHGGREHNAPAGRLVRIGNVRNLSFQPEFPQGLADIFFRGNATLATWPKNLCFHFVSPPCPNVLPPRRHLPSRSACWKRAKSDWSTSS
jgi:hypothetical protein